jgi:hypothetical protein
LGLSGNPVYENKSTEEIKAALPGADKLTDFF